MSRDNLKQPPKKNSPKPTKTDIKKAEYFEQQLIDLAIEAYEKKDYLKSSMLSWSCIEECYLPQLIAFVAKTQKIDLPNDFAKAKISQQIIYYYLLSYDEELYKLLDRGRKLRNDIVHKIYQSGGLKEVAKKAEKSAQYNLNPLFLALIKRLNGEYVIPSISLYTNGWNDAREEFKQTIQNRIDELKGKTKF